MNKRKLIYYESKDIRSEQDFRLALLNELADLNDNLINIQEVLNEDLIRSEKK